jgi:DnaK suppressor protein
LRNKELYELTIFLEGRKVQIEKNLNALNNELRMISQMDLNDEADHAAASSDNSLELAIEKQQREELEEINIALLKIAERTYGVCDMCEEEINVERLKVKPHAKYCIDCREIAEKNQ